MLASHAVVVRRAHGGHPTGAVIDHLGDLGVAVFFVISGWVVYRPFVAARRAGRPVDLGPYAVRRVARIVPAYWVCLAFYAIVLPRYVAGVHGLEAIRYFGFAQIYEWHALPRGLGPAWTLDVEVVFYALVPLLAAGIAGLARRRAELAEALLLGVLALASVLGHLLPHSQVWSLGLPDFFGWFALGMALTRVDPDGRLAAAVRGRRRYAWWAAAAGLYLLLCTRLQGWPRADGYDTLQYVGLGLIATLIVLPARSAPLGRGPLQRAGRWLGERSYGIYLWHYPLLAFLAARVASNGLYAALGAGGAVAAAALSWSLLERPLGARAGRLGRADRATAPASTALTS